MNEEQRQRIEKWRKRQIYCVAAGSLAAILFLMGIAMNLTFLLGLGGIAFLLCLAGIFLGGFFASHAAKSTS